MEAARPCGHGHQVVVSFINIPLGCGLLIEALRTICEDPRIRRLILRRTHWRSQGMACHESLYTRALASI